MLFTFCTYCILRCLVCIVVSCVYCCSCLVCVLSNYVYLLYCVCIAVFTLDAGMPARSQYSEGPATGHLNTGFSCFPCVCKQKLRWFPRFQVATTCFSCSPPDLNLLVINFIFCIHVKFHRMTTWSDVVTHYALIIIIIIIIRYVCLLSQAFLPGTCLEPAVIPTAHASSFTLQYFPYYV